MKNFRILAAAFFVLLVQGCTTVEFDRHRAACDVIALEKYPVSYVTVMKDVRVREEVFDGTLTCEDQSFGGSRARVVCTEGKTTKWTWVSRPFTEDINSSKRLDYSWSCAKQRCQQSMGNEDCKVSSPAVPVVTQKSLPYRMEQISPESLSDIQASPKKVAELNGCTNPQPSPTGKKDQNGQEIIIVSCSGGGTVEIRCDRGLFKTVCSIY